MNTRSVTVRALLANEDGALKPGMFLNVIARQRRTRGAGDSRRGAHARSRTPVRVRGRATARSQRREVRIGGRRPGSVEVLAGLSAGERVIVEGTQKVRDGARCAPPSARSMRCPRTPRSQARTRRAAPRQ